MKKPITKFLLAILIAASHQLVCSIAYAQAPKKMSYQAVIRDGSGNLINTKSVSLKISLLQGSAQGNSIYAETHSVKTNANGLVSLEIGSGTAVSGKFEDVNWANGPYFIKTETDPSGGTNYSISATSQLMSVPYALYAEKSGTPGPKGDTGAIGPIGPKGDAGKNALIKTSIENAGANCIAGGTKIETGLDANSDGVLDASEINANLTRYVCNSQGGQGSSQIPVLTTSVTANVGSGNAEVTASIINSVGAAVSFYGFKYDIKPIDKNSFETYSEIALTGNSFNGKLKNLKANTTYYVKAYLVTENGIRAIGNEVSFTTKSAEKPTVSIKSDSVMYNSAIFNVDVTDNGGSQITESGIYFSTSPDALKGKRLANINFLSFLTPSTTYYVMAYATNNMGTSYSEEINIKTLAPKLAVVETDTISVSYTQVVFKNAQIIDDGGSIIKEYGICISKNPNPTIADRKFAGYIYTITGFDSDSVYYVRAYAINNSGISYGKEIRFKTLAAKLASVSTDSISIGFTNANFSKTINDVGGKIIEEGFYYGTNPNPTASDNKSVSGYLTNLISNTNYFIRAYVINSVGISYGNEINFKTLEQKLAKVRTDSVSVKFVDAQFNCTVEDDGGSSIKEQGVCYSLKPNPSISDKKFGNYTNLTGFNPDSTYYVRAYAINAIGVSYGNEFSFKAKAPILATVKTDSSSTNYTTANFSASVIDNGGANIIEQGVCYSNTQNPTIADKKSSGYLTNLTLDTTYFVRAYAINKVGVAYGNEIMFKTKAAKLAVIKTDSISVAYTTASFGCTVTDDGGEITEKGLCYSTSKNPTVSNYKSQYGYLTNLKPNTIYFIRAYAINNAGIVYGNEISFKTLALQLPTVQATFYSVSYNTANFGVSIGSDGGSSVTEQGVCYNTSPNPTTANSKSYGYITNLTPNTTYYVRSYAINAVGTAYAEEYVIKTLPQQLALISANPVSVSFVSASINFSVSDEGGSQITEQGICYSTNPNPTKSDLKSADGMLKDLTPNTLYYARPYAVNTSGTAYGNQLTFTTLAYTYILGSVTDNEGNTYKTVKIGDQEWMAENLKSTKYANGDLIGSTAQFNTNIASETNPKYQWPYNGADSNIANYGRLYTYYAITDSRGVCPTGWSLPSDTDYTVLSDFLGGASIAGGKLKDVSVNYWKTPNTSATNESGFALRAAGFRKSDGTYMLMGDNGFIALSKEYDAANLLVGNIVSSGGKLELASMGKKHGAPVRCIKD